MTLRLSGTIINCNNDRVLGSWGLSGSAAAFIGAGEVGWEESRSEYVRCEERSADLEISNADGKDCERPRRESLEENLRFGRWI